MAKYAERLWNPGDDAGALSRKDRAPGRFLAYIPDELGEKLPSLGDTAQTAATDAPAVLAAADERVGARGRFLNHLLIRSGEHLVFMDRRQSCDTEEVGDRRATESGQPGRAGCRRERPCDRDVGSRPSPIAHVR